MADLIYTAQLDDKQILAALKRIDASINGLSKKASSDFQAVGKSASASGVQIGAIAGVVASITTSFINLGQQAITALIDIGKQSVETALEVDTLKARLGGIFDGSQEAADQAFTFIQDKSKELGIDLSELAGAFIPKTESLAQFERVAKIATALARSDPEQGAIGARIALIEALSGTFTSIQRRFEIPKEDINRIKEAFDKEGIEGFLTTLETVLKESGKSFEDFAGTATTSFAKLEIAGQQLGGRLGTPIVESLQKATEKINEFVGANEDDLIVFADTIGRAIADVIDFIASVDLSQLDTEQLQQFADYIFSIVNAAQLLLTQLNGLAPAFGTLIGGIGDLSASATGGYNALDLLGQVFTRIDDALITVVRATALAKAAYAGLTASLEPLLDVLGNILVALGQAAAFDYGGAIKSLENAALAIQNSDEAQKAFNESLAESQKDFDNYQSALDGNKDSQQALREELEETANAGTDAADAIQAQNAAARDAAEANAEYEEALAKVNEKFAEAQEELGQKLEDIEIETARKRFDILEEFANKREDLARDNARRLEDIARETSQKIFDAGVDLSREEQDIAIKFARQRDELERSQADKRIDIEVEYRRKLRDIRRQFDLDAEEAERNRDAVGFLRALRQRNEEVNQAQIDRNRAITDTQFEGQRKREELRIQQQQEIDDARLTNERKLEDIRLFNARALAENGLRLDREFEDLRIGEARKLEELDLSRERDIEDAQKAYERKIADLEESLKAELALIQEYEQAKRDEYALTAAAAAAASEVQPPSTTGGDAAGFGDNPGTIGGGPGGNGSSGAMQSTQGRAFGGLVNAGQAVPVGERGPELFVPSSNGRIVPNSAVMMNTQGNGIAGNISNSKTQQINLPITDTGLLQNPIFVAGLRNLILNELGKVS